MKKGFPISVDDPGWADGLFQRMELLAIVVVTIGDVHALDPAEKRIKRKPDLGRIENQILAEMVILVASVPKNVAKTADGSFVRIPNDANPG